MTVISGDGENKQYFKKCCILDCEPHVEFKQYSILHMKIRVQGASEKYARIGVKAT